MTDYSYEQHDFGQQNKVNLPNATAALVLGIIGIITCCCYGGGLIFGIIALILAAKDMKRYKLEPERYKEASYKNLNAGRICAIFSILLSVIFILIMVWAVMTIGIENMQNEEVMQQRMEELFGTQ